MCLLMATTSSMELGLSSMRWGLSILCLQLQTSLCLFAQVEKSVVNKLAAAYEEGVIGKRSHVTLVVGGEGGPSAIRLQVRSLSNKQ